MTYQPPALPPDTHAVALQRVKRAMERYGRVDYTNEGLVGYCPLCGFGLIYRHALRVAVLECGSGCDENMLWMELGL